MVTTYDNQNRVTEALETTNGYARSIWYNYDSANRLISYQKGWAREIYQYDSFGRQRYVQFFVQIPLHGLIKGGMI
jgi:YD repeat-containing protein